MPQSNIGRIIFTSSQSPSNPLVVGLGSIPAGGVKDITVVNMGLAPFYCYGRVNTTDTSPRMLLMAGYRGNIVLSGTAGQTAELRLFKYLEPRYISANSSTPVADVPAVVELEDLGS